MAEKMKQKKDKYQIEYAEKLISWFKNAPLYNTETHKIYSKKSDKCEEVYEKVPAPCPTFVRFADEINVAVHSLEIWKEKYPEFAEAYLKAQLYQEEWLMNAAGLGFYNSSMSISALKANHGWVEKSDNKNRLNDELKQVLVRFVNNEDIRQEKQRKIKDNQGESNEEDNGAHTGDFCTIDDTKIPN